MSTDLAVPEQQIARLEDHELTVEQVIARIGKVHDVMKRAMQEDHHYGVIPGTPKPTLLKPGAELLCVMFRLDPQYQAVPERAGGHLTYVTTCTLWHVPTGQRMGSGMGSCSTREAKYAFRQQNRLCPKCGSTAIIKGKAEYGGGWLCFGKKGGCGAKYAEKDPAILEQVTGRVANEDLADSENTVLKMSNKRALVAAVLNVTAASDIFTQDLEDMPRDEHPAAVVATQGVAFVQPEKVTLVDVPPTLPETNGQETLEISAEDQRAILLGRINAAADKKKLGPATRRELWTKFCGEATKDTADVAALQDLLAAVRGHA